MKKQKNDTCSKLALSKNVFLNLKSNSKKMQLDISIKQLKIASRISSVLTLRKSKFLAINFQLKLFNKYIWNLVRRTQRSIWKYCWIYLDYQRIRRNSSFRHTSKLLLNRRKDLNSSDYLKHKLIFIKIHLFFYFVKKNL